MSYVETPIMITFGVLGGGLFVAGLQYQGNRRAMLVGSSLLSFAGTTYAGAYRLMDFPDFKKNFNRNATKVGGVAAIGLSLGMAGVGTLVSTVDAPRFRVSNGLLYLSAFTGLCGVTAVFVANDMANIVGWEGGPEPQPWWAF